MDTGSKAEAYRSGQYKGPPVSRDLLLKEYYALDKALNKLKMLFDTMGAHAIAVKLFDKYVEEHETKRRNHPERGRDLSALVPMLAGFRTPSPRVRTDNELVEISKRKEITYYNQFYGDKRSEYEYQIYFNRVHDDTLNVKAIIKAIKDTCKINEETPSIEDFAAELIRIYHRELNRGYYGDRGSKATCSLYRNANAFFEQTNIISHLSVQDIALYYLCRIRQEGSNKVSALHRDTIDRLTRLLIDSDGNLRLPTTRAIIRVFEDEYKRAKQDKWSTIAKHLEAFLNVGIISFFSNNMSINYPDNFPTIHWFSSSRDYLVYYGRVFFGIHSLSKTKDNVINVSTGTKVFDPHRIRIDMNKRLAQSGLENTRIVSAKVLPIQGVDYTVLGTSNHHNCFLLVTVQKDDDTFVHAFFPVTAPSELLAELHGFDYDTYDTIINRSIAGLAIHQTSASKSNFIHVVAIRQDNKDSLVYLCGELNPLFITYCHSINVFTTNRDTNVNEFNIKELTKGEYDPYLLAYDEKAGLIVLGHEPHGSILTRFQSLEHSEFHNPITVFSASGKNADYDFQQISPTHIPEQFYISWTDEKSGRITVGMIDLTISGQPKPLVILNPEIDKTYQLTTDGITYETGRDLVKFRCVSASEFGLIGQVVEQSLQPQEDHPVAPQHFGASILSFLRGIGGQRHLAAPVAAPAAQNDNNQPAPTLPGLGTSESE